MAKTVAETFVKQREEMGFPLLRTVTNNEKLSFI